jgi:hypothetical protein
MVLLAHQSGDEDVRSARTSACRVHTRVNALKIVSATLCSEECEHGAHECVRHGASSMESVHLSSRVPSHAPAIV